MALVATIISDYQKFYLTATPNQHYKSPVPFHSEGVSRSSQARDGIAMDARAAKTSAALAYGEIVWVRRPDAGVKFEGRQRCLKSDGVTKSRVTRTISYKP